MQLSAGQLKGKHLSVHLYLENYLEVGGVPSKQRSKKDQEIHDLIMSLPQRPESEREVLPPPPKTLEDAKTTNEVEAYLQSL